MASKGPALEAAAGRLRSRIETLLQRYSTVSAEAGRQTLRSTQSSGNTLEFRRTFDREQFLLHDIGLLTLGEPSRYGRALKEAQTAYASIDAWNEGFTLGGTR